MLHWETEIKLRVTQPALFRKRLRALGASRIQSRHREDNEILDFKDGRIRKAQSLIRLRQAGGRGFLTFKGPQRIERGAKSRPEIEIAVENPDSLMQILRVLGLRTIFRYQKYRTVFRRGHTLITLDETPMGFYAEIEGTPTSIARVARSLGFQSDQFITESYADIYRKYRIENRISSRDMKLDIKVIG